MIGSSVMRLIRPTSECHKPLQVLSLDAASKRKATRFRVAFGLRVLSLLD